MADQKAPPIDPSVVDWLSRVFPDKCPSETDSDRQVWIAVGSQKVVKHLRKLVDKQSENVLHD